MTNNSRSVETAAWSLACEWWDKNLESYAEKSKILLKAVENLGKADMVDQIQEMLQGDSDQDEIALGERRSTSLVTRNGQVGKESDYEEQAKCERNGKIAQSGENKHLAMCSKMAKRQRKKFAQMFRSKPKCRSDGKIPPTLVELKSEEQSGKKLTNGNVQKRVNKYIPTKLLY